MAEFKLGRIRFVWKGDWAAATSYVKDDVIKYGGRTYICQIGHTSDNNFYTDKDFVPTKWNQMTDGQEWRGDWSTSTFYSENDLVKYGGLLYIAVNSHTSAATSALGLEANDSDWELFAEGFDWKGSWTTSTRYKENDLVKYGGYTYVCNTYHTSAATLADGLEIDQSKWDIFNPGIEYKGSWSGSSARYKINDVVKYGAGLWICTTEHTSGGTFASQQSNWSQFVKGFEFENDWNSATTYQPGDIVRYGGNQYISKTNHTTATVPNLDSTNWDLFSEGFNWANAWDFDTNYKIGDVVSVGGYSYLALQNVNQITLSVTATNSVNNQFTTSSTANLAVGMLVRFSGTTFGNIGTNDNYYVRQISSATAFTVSITPGGAEVQPTTGSGTMTVKFTAHPNNATYWNVLNKGIQWRNTWTEGTEYDLGDAVLFGANSYICIQKHKAEQDDGSTIRAEGGGHPNSRPDQDITGTYWNVLAVGSETSVLTTRGDLVYYGDAGPTRLPIGLEGQVLRVSDDFIPEWVTLGGQDYTYYVATNGTDLPAPVHGLSFDKPWKTIRYACEQVEKGPRNPNAKHLLEMNRVFIQREVTEFIQWQIANAAPSSIWENFEYEDYKCERDVGLVVDALMHDLSHGGNVKVRGAANTLVGGIVEDSPGAYPNLAVEKDQSLAAYGYMLQIVTKVLNQEAPTINYQVLNGDNSTTVVTQFFDQDKLLETTALAEITSLVSIITNAITDGTPDNIPARYSPNNLIRIATGDYREVLPIIVPEQTCVQGAELRSTNAGPRVGTTAKEDAKYSIAALGRLEAIVGDIVTGSDVTETSGNSEIQSAEFPFADTAQVTFAERLVRTMQHRIDWKLGTLNLAYTTDPVGYNSSYLIGYGDARKLVKENKKFLQEEVKAWLIINYPNLKYSKTKCYQDVGYLIDALVYDLTYGGNAASVQAGLAYFEGAGSNLYIDSTEKSATLAAYDFLKTRIETVAANIGFTALNDQIVQYRDTAGSAGAVTALGDNMDDIIEIITTGPSAVGTTVTLSDPAVTNGVSSTTALINAYSTLNSAVSDIQVDTIDYINSTYGSFIYDSAKCRRDTGIIIDGVYYDVALGTNYNAVTNGRSYRRAMAVEVINSQLEQTLGAIAYTKTQAADSVDTDATALSRSNAAFDEILDIIENGVAAADALTWSDPGVDVNKRYAREQLQTNRAFIISELSNWISTNYSALWTSLGAEGQATCQRDTGYIIDAISYDIQYGGNTATRVAAEAYFEGAVSVLPAGQKAATSAAFTQLGTICSSVVQETYGGQDTSGDAATGTEGTQCTNLIAIITDVIDADSLSGLPAASNPSISWAAAGIQTAVGQLNTDKTDIVAATLQYITNTFSSLVYDHSKCSRDVATIIKAVGYDFQLNSNWQTVKAAYAYLRETAQEVYQLNQKTATRGALEFVRTQAVINVGGDSTAISRINALMETLDDIIYSGSNEGSPCATEERNDHYAVLQLERNRDYIVAEINAYIADTFTDTATATTASTKAITISDTGWLIRGAAVRFGSAIGGLETGVTYYVQKILSSTTFTVSLTRFADDIDQVAVTDDTGSVAVTLYFNAALCTRDINTYIDALKYDIKYPGNYKSLFAARYYANSVLGSLEEDMFYLRDACGLRDMTLSGLSGDLTPENEYGTSRVTAGAYASLDPGWGPDDFRAWIITRSPYIQGLTTFGNAAIGQKIDGALHNGGNDSMVSNDFTQVISDGIGAWVANNGRAELVSVFTYYSHIGYLSTEGGRIRGTNGNNSYGDFGSVAEGFDSTETPNTAAVDNRFQFVSTVHIINNDGDEMLNYEFENAGIDYTEATWTMTGGGISAATSADEFRDGGVYQVRLLDFGNDSSGQFGGEGYLTNSNTAQGGGSTFVTLAATDDELSTAYVGMKVVLTAGAGAGQYGIITTYNSGTKRADVVRESDGVAGWDHFVPGTPIAVPDASTTYTVEPRITFAAPAFTSSQQTLPTSAAWTAVTYGETAATYTAVTGTYSGTGGAGATFDVSRNGWKYIVNINAGGTDYTRLETITILGTNLGGLSPENDLVLTITSVDSETGAVILFDQDGYGSGGRFVAVRGSSTTAGAYSNDGTTWIASTMPSGTWTGVAAGLIEDGSTLIKVSRFVAIGTGTSAAYSADGINWTASVMPTSATWTSVVYGEGKFVAIASDSTTVAISLDGEVWDITGTLTATGFADITYGKGIFVAVKTSSNIVARSNDGETWTDETLPATTNWNSVAWGNGRFVAISTSSNSGAFSLDGETWTAMTLGPIDGSTTSPSAGYQTVRYGQGQFMATTYITGFGDYAYVATSEDGILWTIKGVDGKVNSTAGFDAIAFGNPQRTPTWVVLDKDTSDEAVKISAGVRAKGRAYVAETKIFLITILEPGSGYTSAPAMTITDPTNLYEAPHVVRIGSGVLANPTFINRGTGYATSGAEINTGDGYADNYQTGGFIAVRRLSQRPVAGSNVVFGHLPDRTFKLVNVITFLGTNDGSYTAFFQVSPIMEVSEAAEHLESVTTRIRYSQVRLTGHDFLDIGTGGFADTNYPGTPLNNPNPANETVGNNGGRVFFTSTDQDGNFRVGDLFAIEQSTGIATLNADAFNISGLQELNLGNVTLGGGSATITEFSTDPFFTADSDNVVPTQRAIKAYISAQIGGGGASLNVNSVTAGSIFISSNVITTTTSVAIKMNTTFEFRGGVTGAPLAFNYYFK